MKLPQRRRPPTTSGGEADNYNALARRHVALIGRYNALAASLPERERALIANTAARLTANTQDTLAKVFPERDQRTADRVIADLRQRGLLREAPARTGVIKTVVRGPDGQIVGLTERTGQIDEPADGAA